ncbi:MAG: anaerobic glycerol-3-phosphate dehydrogenase subunit B [Bacteroidales bacterium]|nr:anaerobic glycerol-3-phosphate dehydrogenase subunit B [Bacteroidales bacterium]
MRFDTVIIGGGLAGLTAGIRLQEAGRSAAIVSTGQNALHFFSGSFESIEDAPAPIVDLFARAGIPLHYRPGVRLMPLGTFQKAALSLEDVSLFENEQFAHKVMIVNFPDYQDFFSAFLSDGLKHHGIACRTVTPGHVVDAAMRVRAGELRSVQIARTMDKFWEKAVEEVRIRLRDEDAVILPQVFGLEDPTIPGRIRAGIPAPVVFVGTLPPSVPGTRTQRLLKRRFEALGGTYLAGDKVLQARVEGDRVRNVNTRNLGGHVLDAEHFILATGSYFSKGLKSNPFRIYEPVFGLDVRQEADRSKWYDADFHARQPYMAFGVETDPTLHPLRDGRPLENLYAIGSVLGATRPDLGFGGGLALRSAFQVVDQILL